MPKAKGLTTKPIRIVCAREWLASPAILALVENGHTVIPEPDPPADLYITRGSMWEPPLLEAEQRKNGETYYPYVVAGLSAGRKVQKAREKK